jgi:hypothetical protein
MRTEDERARRLLDAQASAIALFDEVVARGIIAPGRGEQAVSDQIRDLANEMFGKTRHWHKRIAGHPRITGAQLHAEIARLAGEAGWSLGGTHAGHLVGEFPHEKIDGDRIESYIAPGNATPMRRHDKAGRACHWILEIHLTDTVRQFGGFYEQLLDLG